MISQVLKSIWNFLYPYICKKLPLETSYGGNSYIRSENSKYHTPRLSLQKKKSNFKQRKINPIKYTNLPTIKSQILAIFITTFVSVEKKNITFKTAKSRTHHNNLHRIWKSAGRKKIHYSRRTTTIFSARSTNSLSTILTRYRRASSSKHFRALYNCINVPR